MWSKVFYQVFSIFLILHSSSGKEEEGGKPAKGEGETAREKSSSRIAKDKDSGTGAGSRPASPEPGVPLYDKDLIRMLVEVNFIQGEVCITLQL